MLLTSSFFRDLFRFPALPIASILASRALFRAAKINAGAYEIPLDQSTTRCEPHPAPHHSHPAPPTSLPPAHPAALPSHSARHRLPASNSRSPRPMLRSIHVAASCGAVPLPHLRLRPLPVHPGHSLRQTLLDGKGRWNRSRNRRPRLFDFLWGCIVMSNVTPYCSDGETYWLSFRLHHLIRTNHPSRNRRQHTHWHLPSHSR